MRKLYLIFVILLAFNALAAPTTIDLGMTLPTTNTDSSALVNLDYVQVLCSTTPGGPYIPVYQETNVPLAPSLNTTLTVTVNNCMTTVYGSVYFVVTSTNIFGFPSANSNEVGRTFPDIRIPSAITDLRVTGSTPGN